jgi:hypothetical protein
MSNLHFSGFNVVSSHEITHVSWFNQLNPMEIGMFLGYPPKGPYPSPPSPPAPRWTAPGAARCWRVNAPRAGRRRWADPGVRPAATCMARKCRNIWGKKHGKTMERPWNMVFFVFFCVFMLLIPFLCVCGCGLWYLRINCKQEVNGKPSSCLIFGWATNLGVVSEKRWWFYSQILAVHSYKIWVSGEPFQKHPRTSFEGLNEPMGLG